jgi:Late embryogenesis abundant protein
MKTQNLVLLGVAAIVGLMYFGNLGVAGNVLQYYIQGVDFTGLTSGTIVLMVQNPSNATIKLNSMAGTISANNSTLGNISNFQGGILIPANQQIPVNITVNLSLTSMLGQWFQVLTQPTGQNQINFVIANINSGLIVPFNINQTVNV